MHMSLYVIMKTRQIVISCMCDKNLIFDKNLKATEWRPFNIQQH